MAKIGMSLKIDVTKITKERLYKGKKGTYLDAVVWFDTEQLDQYGNNGMISESTTKEERSQGVKGSILGNSKIFYSDLVSPQSQSESRPFKGTPPKMDDSADWADGDDIPW